MTFAPAWARRTATISSRRCSLPGPITLRITPPLGFTAFGPGGGPFTVASQTYTLKNIGSTALDLEPRQHLQLAHRFCHRRQSEAGASTTVTMSLNPAANKLLIGSQRQRPFSTIELPARSRTAQFDLYVGNGGFETGDLTDWTWSADTELDFALAADDVDVAGTAALPGQSDGLFVHSGLYGAYLGEWAWDGYPAVGSLSQTVATTADQPYLVSFWLTCVPDDQGVTTNNQFIAKWNNSTLYARTNLHCFGLD